MFEYLSKSLEKKDFLKEILKLVGYQKKILIIQKLISYQKRVYEANYSTDEHGLRFSAEVKDISKKSNPKKKLLVIGDSYTGGLYSSDDKAWFAFLDKGLNLDVLHMAYRVVGHYNNGWHIKIEEIY